MQKRHQTIDEPTCFEKFMKLFLIVFNIFVVLLGIAGLGVGIWALTGDFGTSNLEAILDTDLYTVGASLIIIGGSVIIITGCFGIFGAAFGNRTLLGIYFGIMVFFAMLYVAGFIVGFFFLDEIEKNLSDKMTDSLKNKYHVNMTTNSDNKDITNAWDDFQRSLKCCGVEGDLTSETSWFLWQSSQWFEDEGKASPSPLNYIYVPSSCCNSDEIFDNCQLLNSVATKPPQTTASQVTTENAALYHKGCIDALEDKVDDHMVSIITIAIITFVMIVVCAVFAILVCMEAGRVGKVV